MRANAWTCWRLPGERSGATAGRRRSGLRQHLGRAAAHPVHDRGAAEPMVPFSTDPRRIMRAVTLPLASGEVRLSVVIASYNSIETIARCLRSLETQDARQAYEVIVVDSSTDGTADLVRREFPSVRLFVCSERKFPGDARNIGVSRALGDLIAFTDADCFVDASWVSRVVDAHDRTDHGVIGGAVENGNPGSYVGWAHYFSEFSSWMPHVARARCSDPHNLPDDEAMGLREIRPFWSGRFPPTTARSGGPSETRVPSALFLPTIRVSHINITSLTVLLGHRVCRGVFREGMAEQRSRGLRRIACYHSRQCFRPSSLDACSGSSSTTGFTCRGSWAPVRWCSLASSRGRGASCSGTLSTPQPHAHIMSRPRVSVVVEGDAESLSLGSGCDDAERAAQPRTFRSATRRSDPGRERGAGRGLGEDVLVRRAVLRCENGLGLGRALLRVEE
jgi:hypothetical protein